MKRHFAISLLLLGSCFLNLSLTNAQSGSWVWMNGSQISGDTGHFGTQGVPSVSNTPPALYQAIQWTDKQGNFWIFAGLNFTTYNYYSDMWEYNPTENTWTWIKGSGLANEPPQYGTEGVPGINNTPGARSFGSSSWTDSSGNLWFFGGLSSAGSETNDLWRYNITTNEWTWMSGAGYTVPNYGNLYQESDSSLPSMRSEVNTAWIDASNNLWLFGGFSTMTIENFDDLWRYDIGTGQWAWMGGSKITNTHDVYGVMGVESPANLPGARESYTHWINGNYLYLSGGVNNYAGISYNDVWQFNLNTNAWTWIGGDMGNVTNSAYNGYCSATNGSQPPGRLELRSVQTNACSPVLYIWGGTDLRGRTLNDLWTFDLPSGKWQWVSGSSGLDPAGSYGTKGVSAPSNMPPGLMGTCFWSDNHGNLWLWAGMDVSQYTYNALWKYTPDNSCFQLDTGGVNWAYNISPQTICSGDSAIVNFSGGSLFSISPSNHVSWLDSLHAVLNPDTSTFYIITGTSACNVQSTQMFTLAVVTDTVNILSDKQVMCPGDTAQICAPSGLSSYSWNTGDTTACINATSAGNYYVTVTESNRCQAISNHTGISIYPPIAVSTNITGDTLRGFDASSYQWLLNNVAITGATDSVYIAKTGGSYTLQITDSNSCIETSTPIIISGISNQPAENSIAVFPNPTSSGWQLNVSGQWIGGMAEVFDATGRCVFKSTIINSYSLIEISGLASGVYELRITQILSHQGTGFSSKTQDSKGFGYSVVKKLVKM